MYPILCKGGYPFPIQKGMKSIVGVLVTAASTAAASRIALIDSDADKVVTDDGTVKPCICDLKGIANTDGTLGIMFPEPIKVRDGVALSSLSSNLSAGKTFVYVR